MTKKKNKATALVITSKAIQPPAVIPKASKSDIIRAAVERARTKHEEETTKLRKVSEEKYAKIKEAALEEIDKSGVRSMDPAIYVPSYNERCQVTVDIASPRVKKLVKEYHALKNIKGFDEKAVKVAITDSMDGTMDRVNLTLSIPENIAKLDAVLDFVFPSENKTIEN